MLNKIVIIGDGRVGSTLAYTLFLKSNYQLSIIDLDSKKTIADLLDMQHGQIISDSKIKYSDYKACKDADIIVITASIRLNHVGSRTELLEGNLKLLKSILEQIKPYLNNYSKIILISNPVDTLTYFTYKYLNIEANRVIGSGTYLDSLRFQYYLAEALNVSLKSISAYVVGEHGDSEVPIFSSVKIGGVYLQTYLDANKITLNKEDLIVKTVKGGYLVANDKGYTNYAVSIAVFKIIEAILTDSNEIFPVTTYFTPKKVFLSLPVTLNNTGISSLVGISCNDEEIKKVNDSIEILLKHQEIADNFLKND